MLRFYGYVGIAMMAFAIANFALVIQPFARWYIPIIWLGYILLVDSLAKRVGGVSIISDYPREFVFMAAVSVPFWLIFEAYNIVGGYWQYTNYTWHAHLLDFATILPAVLVTFVLMRALGLFKGLDVKGCKPARPGRRGAWPLVVFGAAVAAMPFVLPAAAVAVVWVGLFLLIDPINYIVGRVSIAGEFAKGRRSMVLQLFLSGIIMGFLWEMWNSLAYSKWAYSIVLVGGIPRLFAMPIPGYLGYLPFALEAFAFYALFRPFLFKGRNRALGI